jgi:hypothetical protein
VKNKRAVFFRSLPKDDSPPFLFTAYPFAISFSSKQQLGVKKIELGVQEM